MVFILINIIKKKRWILPIILVTTNWIYTKLFASLFGKTKFLKLIPNFSFEGYLGGLFANIFTAIYVQNFYSKSYKIDYWDSLII